MSSKVQSAAVVGLDAELVEVEAELGGGDLGKFYVVGLPDTAISESRERVRSAVKNSGLSFPKLKVAVSLAPANLKKQGPSYDLPIALSILLVADKLRLPPELLQQSIFIGELALSGALRPIAGVLPIALAAQRLGIKQLFVPEANAAEAKLAPEIEVYGVKNLTQLLQHLVGRKFIEPTPATPLDLANAAIMFDMAHVAGQEHVKRAMEIVAAGGHNVLVL